MEQLTLTYNVDREGISKNLKRTTFHPNFCQLVLEVFLPFQAYG
jgi:hypothetical protein